MGTQLVEPTPRSTMYFRSQLAIDPSSETFSRAKRPTKFFARLARALTVGLNSSREEVETFCAVAMMQQLNRALRSVGIDNVVRVAKDGTDIYFDDAGRTDDLKAGLERFVEDGHSGDSRVFEYLELVVEHADAELEYLFDFRLRRTHAVGEAPVVVTINGLIQIPATARGDDSAPLLERARQELQQEFFCDQATYDRRVEELRARFEAQVGSLAAAIEREIAIDAVEQNSRDCIVRADARCTAVARYQGARWADPIFHGYAGFAEKSIAAQLWSEMCFDHGIRVSGATLVRPNGTPLVGLSQQGWLASAGPTFDPDRGYGPPLVAAAIDAQYVSEAPSPHAESRAEELVHMFLDVFERFNSDRARTTRWTLHAFITSETSSDSQTGDGGPWGDWGGGNDSCTSGGCGSCGGAGCGGH